MIGNIHVPHWLRWLAVVVLLSQLAANSVQIITSWQQTQAVQTITHDVTRFEHHLDACEGQQE